MKTQKYMNKYKKTGVLQRLNIFNLHNKNNSDINFDYHFEANKGWMEIFLNSRVSYKRNFLEGKLDKDINESLMKKTPTQHNSTFEYYKDFTHLCIDFNYLFDNYKGEKITIENGSFDRFFYRLDNDLDCFKGNKFLSLFIFYKSK